MLFKKKGDFAINELLTYIENHVTHINHVYHALKKKLNDRWPNKRLRRSSTISGPVLGNYKALMFMDRNERY